MLKLGKTTEDLRSRGEFLFALSAGHESLRSRSGILGFKGDVAGCQVDKGGTHEPSLSALLVLKIT